MRLVFVCIHSLQNAYICVYDMFIHGNCLYNVSNIELLRFTPADSYS